MRAGRSELLEVNYVKINENEIFQNICLRYITNHLKRRGFLETTFTYSLSPSLFYLFTVSDLKGKKQMDKPFDGSACPQMTVHLCWPEPEESPGSVCSI